MRQKRKYLQKPKLCLYMSGSDIECVTKYKILGVVIDQNLTWNEHINEMSNNNSV